MPLPGAISQVKQTDFNATSQQTTDRGHVFRDMHLYRIPVTFKAAKPCLRSIHTPTGSYSAGKGTKGELALDNSRMSDSQSDFNGPS